MGNKILVIDDGREVRDFLTKSILAMQDFEVLTARDGEQGLALARTAQPDLIIADQYMPGLTGLQVINTLRAEGHDTPAILITGEGSDKLAKEAGEAGVSAYILKPFDSDEMLAAIGRALRDVQRQREMARLAGELQAANTRVTGRLQELQALTGIGQAITAQLDLDTVLGKVVEAAVSLTGAEEGSVLLLDEQTGELTMRAAKNFDEDFARTFRLRADDSPAGEVIRTGRPLLINGAAPQKIKTAYLVYALIYVPLRAFNRVIGVLGVDNRHKQHTFSHDERRLMLALADYAAIAIQNARMFQEVQIMAITDSLTGLHNRRHFFELAGREYERARRYARPLCALMLDIDHFKDVNDTYGHAVGDRVLRAVATLCRTSLRDIDILGRYGGEEFAVLLPEIAVDGAYQAAERLRRRVAELPIDAEPGQLTVTLSGGVAGVTEDCLDLSALLSRADAAMYAAKAAGRNRVEMTKEPGTLGGNPGEHQMKQAQPHPGPTASS